MSFSKQKLLFYAFTRQGPPTPVLFLSEGGGWPEIGIANDKLVVAGNDGSDKGKLIYCWQQ